MSRSSRWTDRSDEVRNRCKATERRVNGRLVQCSEDRRESHEHQNRGRKFSEGYQEVTPGGPTLAPGQVKVP